MTHQYKAVIFDLGGVVVGSPLHAIRDFEAERGIQDGTVNRHVAGSAPHGAWHRLERGELTMGDDFFAAFDSELGELGHADFSTREMMARIREIGQPRPQMLEAIERLKAAELVVGALTNNWTSDDEGAEDGATNQLRSKELHGRFHAVIESAVVGLRKPDPRIYRLACETLGVELEESVFLDDIGTNLKGARALGMKTIKVDDPDEALRELGGVLSLDLL
ncbi:MAG: HAD family phosphatase [Acidobacteriota bacterium]